MVSTSHTPEKNDTYPCIDSCLGNQLHMPKSPTKVQNVNGATKHPIKEFKLSYNPDLFSSSLLFQASTSVIFVLH